MPHHVPGSRKQVTEDANMCKRCLKEEDTSRGIRSKDQSKSDLDLHWSWALYSWGGLESWAGESLNCGLLAQG